MNVTTKQTSCMWERWGIRGGSPLYQHSLSALKIQYSKCGMKPSKLCRFNNPNENISQYVCIYPAVLNYVYWNYGSFPIINKNGLNHTAQEKEYCFAGRLFCKYKEKTEDEKHNAFHVYDSSYSKMEGSSANTDAFRFAPPF